METTRDDTKAAPGSGGEKASNLTRGKIIVRSALAACIASLAAGITAWLAIYLSPGTPGLMKWVPKYALYFGLIPVVSALPFLLLAKAYLLGALAKRSASGSSPAERSFRRAPGVLAIASAVLGALIALALAAFIAWFIAGSRAVAPHGTPILLPAGTVDRPLRRIAFSSDPHFGAETRNPEATANILQTVDSRGYDAFFVLGDLSETGFPGAGLEAAADALAKGLPETPLAALAGNHDYLIGGLKRFARIFGSTSYRRFDSGPLHVIALDLPWGTERFSAKQRDWLVKALDSIPPRDFTVVLSHCYFWASGYDDPESGKHWYDHEETIAEVAPILAAGGVDLVISGHNHYMEYLEAGGVSWAIIGAMGGIPDPEPTYRSPASKWFRQGEFGFADLDTTGDEPILTFRDQDGTELHKVAFPAMGK